MKNHLLTAMAIALLCSCTKVDVLAPPHKGAPGAISQGPTGVENLGSPFSGTNISWKINPLNPNISPVFTKGPNHAEGMYMLMIDNGPLSGATPLTAFKFVVVNFQNLTSQIVPVKNANGQVITSSLGRIVRYIFGMDKKFYVATESAAGGGGHLVQYDPATQTAVDLGKPFKLHNQYLDIYQLNIGTDGALYGGSFGGDGQVMTFRYDYQTLQSDQTPIDQTSRYVTSISGDNRYTYVVCGKNNWFLYAIDRQTGTKKLLKSNPGNGPAISIASHSDAPYAHESSTHYQLQGTSLTALPVAHRPMTSRMEYIPYAPEDNNLPQVGWDNEDNKLIYTLPGGQTGSVSISGLYQDVYPTNGPLLFTHNKLFISSAQKGVLGSYSTATGFKTLGSSNMSLYAMAAPYTTGESKLYIGGYPKGQLLQYNMNQPWSVNLPGAFNTGTGAATSTSNPQLQVLFQDADASGTNGSMIILGSVYTRSGHLITAGNNDRITTSSGRELSIGSMKHGVHQNLYLPEFSQYEFRSMTLSYDSNYALVCALPKSGSIAKIFKYDPASNAVVQSWELPLWGDRFTSISTISPQLIAGICDDAVYLFDVMKGSIVWKQTTDGRRKLYSMVVAPDHSVMVTMMNNSPTNFKVARYIFDLSHAKPSATVSTIAEFNDAHHNEKYKPTGMAMANQQGTHNLYIAGLLSLYRINIPAL